MHGKVDAEYLNADQLWPVLTVDRILFLSDSVWPDVIMKMCNKINCRQNWLTIRKWGNERTRKLDISSGLPITPSEILILTKYSLKVLQNIWPRHMNVRTYLDAAVCLSDSVRSEELLWPRDLIGAVALRLVPNATGNLWAFMIRSNMLTRKKERRWLQEKKSKKWSAVISLYLLAHEKNAIVGLSFSE